MDDRAKLLARLEAALATLPPRTREVFLLHRVADLAYPDIAERLDVDVRVVERELAEALFLIDVALRTGQEEGGT
ncbi:sigma factor-like helix-turn-helix DNA-binding protein [Allosphingosinicella deserti]|nr:sigma factor-like helix-turn-helix DNA-binding protein [Sphingomonas deserti]